MLRIGNFYEFNQGYINELQTLDNIKASHDGAHFLIFAQNPKEAFKLAMSHITGGYPVICMEDVSYRSKHYAQVPNVVTMIK